MATSASSATARCVISSPLRCPAGYTAPAAAPGGLRPFAIAHSSASSSRFIAIRLVSCDASTPEAISEMYCRGPAGGFGTFEIQGLVGDPNALLRDLRDRRDIAECSGLLSDVTHCLQTARRHHFDRSTHEQSVVLPRPEELTRLVADALSEWRHPSNSGFST